MLKLVALKPVIAATALLAIAGSTLCLCPAELRRSRRNGGPVSEYRHHLSAANMAAFTDARIAALKAGLELTPDQAKNWPAFEQAVRDMAQLRIQRMQARRRPAIRTLSGLRRSISFRAGPTPWRRRAQR